MDATHSMSTKGRAGTMSGRARWRDWRLVVAALMTALLVSACGGGGDDCCGAFSVGVSVDGQVVTQGPVRPGDSISLVIRADQAIVVDAGESVFWTLYVGGSAFPAGSLVHYAGVDIQITALSTASVVVDTRADFALAASVPITLIATSTYDSAEFGVNVLITN